MPFSESQLATWAHQGSVTQSAGTYATIRNALLSHGSPLANHDVEIFLQGSYGNDTNIWSESDVDIVVCLKETYQSNSIALPPSDRLAWSAARIPVTYPWDAFKVDVLRALVATFGSAADPGRRAIAVAASGNRRKADVIPCVSYRHYNSFTQWNQGDFVEGICFWDSSQREISNFPKQHAANLTRKHQATYNRFKPFVRIVKNMRSRMMAEGYISAGQAPSYFVEGLLYNAPDRLFQNSWQTTMTDVLTFVTTANLSDLLCPNRMDYLVLEGSPTSWPMADARDFIQGLSDFWEQG